MRTEIPTFQKLLQNFFLQRLIQHRKVSGETINSYRDTFRIYLNYLSEVYSIEPMSIEIVHLNLEYLQGFCRYLEEKRNNKAVTINNRLSAIKSFLHYVSEMEPEYSEIIKKALMIPFQKHEEPVMGFVTKDEFNAMLNVCDTSTFLGSRDKLMLLILYNSGARISEILALKCSDLKDIDIPGRTSLRILGKGRKERLVPLWKTTSRYLKKYIITNDLKDNDSLFYNKNGDKLTRSGARFRISKIVEQAAISMPSLGEKNITPHSFRHSTAMNLLQSGVDISTIAIWLGHSSIETTHKYMVADMENKRKAMEKVGSFGNASYKYKPSADLLSFLNSL